MDKKRKRASFSPTITIEPDIYKDEVEDKKPAISQMVEVVVEQKGSKKSAPPPKINIVLPKASSRHAVEIDDEDDLEEESVRLVEKKLPVSRQVVEEVVDEVEEAVEEEEEEVVERPQTKHQHVVVEAQETQEEDEEVEEVVEQKKEDEEVSQDDEENEPEEVEVVAEVRTTKKHTKAEENEEKEEQKTAVAELFGKNSSSTMPEITIHKSTNNKSLIIWAITMVAIAIGVGGGLVLFTSYKVDTPAANNTTPTAVVSPKTTSAPLATPAPTKAAVSKSAVSVQVQNGGGKVGAGSKMKAFLEGAGYSVDDVGNASSYNFEETEIVVKASVADLLPTLEKDLGDEYTLGTSKTTLPETSTYDVRVIVGKN